MASFKIIAAVTKNWGLGSNNGLPWERIPSDMEWFRAETMGSFVIMGRKTWDSLENIPLEGRICIVVTTQNIGHPCRKRKMSLIEDPVYFCRGFDTALLLSRQLDRNKQIYVIGGAQLFEEALKHPNCNEVLINHIEMVIKEVDCFFPPMDPERYHLASVIDQGTGTIILRNGIQKATKYTKIRYQPRQARFLENFGDRSSGTNPKFHYVGETGYLAALQDIKDYGVERIDRTGVGTLSLFGLHFRYDLTQGFPLLTTKLVFWRGIIGELLWFISGSTDVSILREQGIHIWDGNTSRSFLDSVGLTEMPEWDIGASYSHQFRHSGAEYHGKSANYKGLGYDQIAHVIREIRNNPQGRRALINLWNPSQLNSMALPPCLYGYQFYVDGSDLSCLITQRSADMFHGYPFNIASASLLTHMIARVTGLRAKELIHNTGDSHIYKSHMEAVQIQLSRTPKVMPQLEISERGQKELEDFVASDFSLVGYYPDGMIKADMAV